ncbi:MAG: PHB depolymerase family esterase [Nocardioides sp.]
MIETRRAATAVLLMASLALAILVPTTARAAPEVDPTACRTQLDAGRQRLPVTSQGLTYGVLVHLPRRLATKTRLVPLVVNLHGSTQSGAASLDSTRLDRAADRHGFIVASPDGGIPRLPIPTGGPGYFWNVPDSPMVGDLPVPPGSRDDVRFLLDLVRTLQRRACIDPRRTYLTGASNGGRMTSAMACLHADVFAAVAPVAGVRAGYPDARCQPVRPIPLLAAHGRRDPVNPYEGNGRDSESWGYGVEEAMRRWARVDGCAPRPRARRTTTTITTLSWHGCEPGADVVLVRSRTGGHGWIGHPTPPPFNLASGPDDLSLDLNDVIWDFFASHPLSARAPR